jgi:hypothetical protein
MMHFNIMLTTYVLYSKIVKGKEEGNNNQKRRPISGLMVMLLYFSKKAKFLIIIGAILAAIGFIVGSYFGSIVITEVSQGKMNQVTSTPYLVNGIDPFLAEKILFGIGILGIAIIGLGLASRKRHQTI